MSAAVSLSRFLVFRPQFQSMHRTPTQILRRFASNASHTQAAAASSAAARMQQTFNNFMTKSGPALALAVKGLSTALENAGGRTGKFAALLQTMIPPTMYYSKVGLELARIVFKARKMDPPTIAEFQTCLDPIFKSLQNRKDLMARTSAFLASSLTKPALANGAVVASELVGFFTVGTMIGRMKIVGYRGDNEHDEHL